MKKFFKKTHNDGNIPEGPKKSPKYSPRIEKKNNRSKESKESVRVFKTHETISYKEAKSLPSHLRKESLMSFYKESEQPDTNPPVTASFRLPSPSKRGSHRPLDDIFPGIVSDNPETKIEVGELELDPDSQFYGDDVKPKRTEPWASCRANTIADIPLPRKSEIVTDMRANLSESVVMRGSSDRYQIVKGQKKILNLEAEFRMLLENPAKLKLFKRFVEKEFCGEALAFWLEVESFRQRNFKKQQMQKAAEAIYEKYIDSKSPFALNIDGEVHERIKEDMLDPHPFMFQEIQGNMFELMKNDSFRKFRTSSEYLEYLEREEVEALSSSVASRKNKHY